MTLLWGLLHTGGGSNLVSKLFIDPSWTSHIKRQNVFKLRSANNQPFTLEKVILFPSQKCNLRVRMWFKAFDHQAADLFLGTALVDKYTRWIFSTERNLVLWHSQPVDVILIAAKTQSAATNADLINSQPTSAPVAIYIHHSVVVSKAVTLALHSHTLELIKSTGSGKRVMNSLTTAQIMRLCI